MGENNQASLACPDMPWSNHPSGVGSDVHGPLRDSEKQDDQGGSHDHGTHRMFLTMPQMSKGFSHHWPRLPVRGTSAKETR